MQISLGRKTVEESAVSQAVRIGFLFFKMEGRLEPGVRLKAGVYPQEKNDRDPGIPRFLC